MVKPHRLYFAATIVSYAFLKANNKADRYAQKQKNCMGQIDLLT